MPSKPRNTKAEEDAVRIFLERLPQYRWLLQEHLHDNYGELLLHVLFGEIGAAVCADVNKLLQESRHTELRMLLENVSAAVESVSGLENDFVTGALLVSFFPALESSKKCLESITEVLGPRGQAIYMESLKIGPPIEEEREV
ncbi:MAG: hypothetical protein JO193_09585 [Candidatus Eremiobacteraeota bacterium]|nr:hypothetical protein [Candidatus Eremiobacteraeota bacterium]MBV9972269.1 hypothetical protein [Candidatus Eremiobacteraeota bacterium]